MNHKTAEYARIRIRNLTARIELHERCHPDTLLHNNKTAKQQLRLDRATLKRWQEILAECKEAENLRDPEAYASYLEPNQNR